MVLLDAAQVLLDQLFKISVVHEGNWFRLESLERRDRFLKSRKFRHESRDLLRLATFHFNDLGLDLVPFIFNSFVFFARQLRDCSVAFPEYLLVFSLGAACIIKRFDLVSLLREYL